MYRRQYLAAVGAAGLGGCGLLTQANRDTSDVIPGVPDAVGLETVASGLIGPVDVVFVPDEDLRYIAEQRGVIRVHDEDGMRPSPLLDIQEAVERGYEQGLLGIALHPDFESNRRLFVRYSAPPRAGTPDGYTHTFVLSEFRVTQDGMSVQERSEHTLLEIPQPQANHNSGAIEFGPDDYLYVGAGDGGGSGDQGRGHVEDWYTSVSGGNAQNTTENLLGGILRLDVDTAPEESASDDAVKGYRIPDDNPLSSRDGLGEYYAWGFRNPWRFSFDRETLYAGDVGQHRYEEVDVVEKGGNYGWNVKEGTHCYAADSCPDRTPRGVRGGEPLLDPVIEYPHADGPVSGVSVIAGNVYRGSALPGMEELYVFGDFRAENELFVSSPTDDPLWKTEPLPVAEDDVGKLRRLRSFERDEGELYVVGSGNIGGGLHRMQPP